MSHPWGALIVIAIGAIFLLITAFCLAVIDKDNRR